MAATPGGDQRRRGEGCTHWAGTQRAKRKARCPLWLWLCRYVVASACHAGQLWSLSRWTAPDLDFELRSVAQADQKQRHRCLGAPPACTALPGRDPCLSWRLQEHRTGSLQGRARHHNQTWQQHTRMRPKTTITIAEWLNGRKNARAEATIKHTACAPGPENDGTIEQTKRCHHGWPSGGNCASLGGCGSLGFARCCSFDRWPYTHKKCKNFMRCPSCTRTIIARSYEQWPPGEAGLEENGRVRTCASSSSFLASAAFFWA